MEKYLYLNSLYDCYGKLLTKKQQMYFEEYYFENLSLSEISENDQVSRSAVSKQLKIVEQKLYAARYYISLITALKDFHFTWNFFR